MARTRHQWKPVRDSFGKIVQHKTDFGYFIEDACDACGCKRETHYIRGKNVPLYKFQPVGKHKFSTVAVPCDTGKYTKATYSDGRVARIENEKPIIVGKTLSPISEDVKAGWKVFYDLVESLRLSGYSSIEFHSAKSYLERKGFNFGTCIQVKFEGIQKFKKSVKIGELFDSAGKGLEGTEMEGFHLSNGLNGTKDLTSNKTKEELEEILNKSYNFVEPKSETNSGGYKPPYTSLLDNR